MADPADYFPPGTEVPSRVEFIEHERVEVHVRVPRDTPLAAVGRALADEMLAAAGTPAGAVEAARQMRALPPDEQRATREAITERILAADCNRGRP